MAFDKKNLIGFVDVASDKMRVMIMSVDKNFKFVLEGKGESESVGYKGGRVVNFDNFSKSINQALEMAEKQVGENISDVVISVPDLKYKSYSLSSKTDFPFERKITEKEIKQCFSFIPLQRNIDLDKEVLIHIVPVEFVIDENKIIDNPVGNFAKNLLIKYHIITGDALAYSELISVFNNLNLNVKKVVASSYASALSVLIDDDKKVGSLLLDIGKSSVSAIVFCDNKIVYNTSLPLGGDAITTSLSKQINVRILEAERLKLKYGAKAPLALDFSDYINLFMIGENGEDEAKEVLKSDFLTVSNNITKGIFSILKKCLEEKDVLRFINRVVLTGGGSKLLGLDDIVSEVFSCPVRIAKPVKKEELCDNLDDAVYSALVGLFVYYKTKDAGDYKSVLSNDVEHKTLFNKFMKFWMENFG